MREVVIDDIARGQVSLTSPVLRFDGNPILTADVNGVWDSPALQVVTVHNAGAAVVDGHSVLLFRSHLRCGRSVLGVARSRDGVTGWTIDPRPALLPAGSGDEFADGVDVAAAIDMESGGVEDARLNPVDGTIAVTYSAYHDTVRNRVRRDGDHECLRSFLRHGPMLERDMRNVVIFPERIDGRWLGLFRPNDRQPGDVGGVYTQIRVGTADDVAGPWQIEDEPILATDAGPSAFSDKIGPGAPPVLTRSCRRARGRRS